MTLSSGEPQLYTLKFWLLCLSSFLFFASFNMIIPELPDYLTSMGGGDHKGLIIPLFTFTAGLSRPFSGKLTDSVGRIPIMVYGVLVCIVCGVLYAVVTGVVAFFVLRLIHGMSTGFKPTATSAYVGDIAPEHRRGEAMGILGVFGSMGMAAGPALGSWLVMEFSYNIMFYASSLSALLSILVIAWMPETLILKKKFKFDLLKIKWIDVYEPRAWRPAIVMGLSVFSFGVVLTIIPDYSKHLGIANKGVFFAVFTIASLVMRLVAGKASDKYGRERVLMVGMVLLATSMIFLGVAHTQWQLYVASIIFGLSAGINSPTVFAWTIDLANPKFRGRALATVFIAMEIGIGLGGLFSGYVYNNQVERFPLVFISAGILPVIALFLLLRMVFIKKSEQN